MITVKNVTKKFEDFTALKDMSCTIPKGCIYGLVGSNGAGKSTFLRVITGVYRPESGAVYIDNMPVYENPAVKQRFTYVPDELYFLPQASLQRMSRLYAANYAGFDFARYNQLTKLFQLNPTAPLNTFSKGMRRQAATILALSCKPDYIFFDETFDGLDPVMRNLVKKIVYDDVYDRQATAVITSHSLRELEDTCDQLALLHKGGMIFESEIGNLKTSLFKLQVVVNEEYDARAFSNLGIEVKSFKKTGSVYTLIMQGDRADVSKRMRMLNPVFMEILPLTLEEVFLHEMEALGYAFPEYFRETEDAE